MAAVIVTTTNKLTATIPIIIIANITDTSRRPRLTQHLQLIDSGQKKGKSRIFRPFFSLSVGQGQKLLRFGRRPIATKEKPRLLWAFNPIAQAPAQSNLRHEKPKIAHSRLTGNRGNPVDRIPFPQKPLAVAETLHGPPEQQPSESNGVEYINLNIDQRQRALSQRKTFTRSGDAGVGRVTSTRLVTVDSFISWSSMVSSFKRPLCSSH
jgi:hypothetical protein